MARVLVALGRFGISCIFRTRRHPPPQEYETNWQLKGGHWSLLKCHLYSLLAIAYANRGGIPPTPNRAHTALPL